MPQVYMHFLWTSTLTHPLGISWKMIPFPQHLKLTFIFVRAREQNYGWLLGHLSICFTLHILLSPQRYIFVSV